MRIESDESLIRDMVDLVRGSLSVFEENLLRELKEGDSPFKKANRWEFTLTSKVGGEEDETHIQLALTEGGTGFINYTSHSGKHRFSRDGIL